MYPENLLDSLCTPQIIYSLHCWVMSAVYHLPVESWLMLMLLQGTFTSKVHTTKWDWHVWSWYGCRACAQGPQLWLADSSNSSYFNTCMLTYIIRSRIHSTGIKEKCINFFYGMCEWLFALSRQECILSLHREELDCTKTIQWYLRWVEQQLIEGFS